jgi:hypothetical protein
MEKPFSEILNNFIDEDNDNDNDYDINDYDQFDQIDEEYYNYLKLKECDIYDVNKLPNNKCYICKDKIEHNMLYCKKYYCNMNDSKNFYKFHNTFIKLFKDNKI